MKTLKVLLSSIFMLITIVILAQAPQAFKYQTIVRDASGEVVQNQNISLQFSIRDGSPDGTILYQETHDVQTNAFGLVNVEVGNGILVSGSMSNIDWGADAKFLETEIDTSGGDTFVLMGTSELLSVPYALNAETTNDHRWGTNGTSIFYNSGNVGIGTDSPGTDLDVQGHIWQSGTGNSIFIGEDAGKDDDLSDNNNTYVGVAAGRGNVSGSNNVAIGYYAGYGNEIGSNNIYIGANASSISTGANDRLNIGNTIYANLSNGQVGIGTTSPIVDLDIRDNDGVALLNLTSNYGSARLSLDKENLTDAAYVSFNTNSTLQWALGTIGDDAFSISKLWSAADGTLYIDGDGKMGIGTTSPGAKLDVAGHIWQTETGQSVFVGEWAGASDDLSDNKNTYLGYNAGGYNYSGSKNVMIGYNAGTTNYTGSNNIIIGAEASGDYYSTSNFMNLGGLLYGDLENKQIGIGISYPNSTLNIYDVLHSTIRLQNTMSGTGTTNGSVISHSGADNSLQILNYEESDITLSAGSYSTVEIAIKSSGRVGIGTTSPGAKLDVDGHIWQSGTGESVFIGEGAGANDDLSDNGNTFVGNNTGTANTSGSRNSAFGYFAMSGTTVGQQNTASGSYAMYSNTTGNGNTAVGFMSLYDNQSGVGNTAVGFNALDGCLGSYNIAVGINAGSNLISGSDNILLGCNAPNPNGSDQMYLGGVLYGNLSNGRIGIGTTSPAAGLHIKGSGFPNSFLYIESGYNQDAGIRLYEGSTDKWHIFNNETTNGLQIYNTAGKTVFFAQQSSGNVGIGTTSPEHTLHINGSEVISTGSTCGFKFRDRASSTVIDDWVWYAWNDYAYFYKSGPGNIWTVANDGKLGIRRTPTANMLEIQGNASKSTAGSWLANSDKRIKTNICDIDNASELVMGLHPVKFKYTEDWKKAHPEIDDHFYYNFIAQEFWKVFPDAVQGSGEYLEGDKNEILQIDTYNAQVVTIKAVQELIEQNKAQEEIINSQQKILETLQVEVEKLKSMVGGFSKL